MTSPATTSPAPRDPARASAGAGARSSCQPPRAVGSAPPMTAFTELFPPADADVARHRSWLARSPWPEVVFASAR